jgi:hypothetical protein
MTPIISALRAPVLSAIAISDSICSISEILPLSVDGW